MGTGGPDPLTTVLGSARCSDLSFHASKAAAFQVKHTERLIEELTGDAGDAEQILFEIGKAMELSVPERQLENGDRELTKQVCWHHTLDATSPSGYATHSSKSPFRPVSITRRRLPIK